MNLGVRQALTQLIDGTLAPDEPDIFRELYEALLNGYAGAKPDEYFILQDFDSYQQAQRRVDEAYRDKARWARMAATNTANSGKFSSDRTIRQYAEEIWKLKKIR
jgi:starch phosphorylase